MIRLVYGRRPLWLVATSAAVIANAARFYLTNRTHRGN